MYLRLKVLEKSWIIVQEDITDLWNANMDNTYSENKSVASKKLIMASPVWFMLIMALSIFVLELIVMTIISKIPPFSSLIQESFFDSTMLVVLLSPTLYIFLFRPLVSQIIKREWAEEMIVRLSTFPEHNPNPIVETDFEGHVTYLNPAAKNHFHDLEENGAQHPLLDGLRSIVSQLEKADKKYFVREVQIGDSIYEQRITSHPESDLIRIFANDLTERVKAEEALRESEEKYRTILENIEDGYCEVDIAGNLPSSMIRYASFMDIPKMN